MTPEAIRCFRFLCELSLHFDVIDWGTFSERMGSLMEVLDLPGSPWEAIDEAVDVSRLGEGSTGAQAHSELEVRPTTSNDDWFKFLGPGTFKDWHFWIGDPDPLPSVPHGHLQKKRYPKLDPYLGWVFSAPGKTSSRFSKADIAGIWNDERFRNFASAALLHFVREYPSHHWRVAHPQRLPRRR